MDLPFLKSVTDLAESLKTSLKEGLAANEAAERLNTYGKNELIDKGSKSALAILFDQLKELMVLILIGAAVISYFLHDPHEGPVPIDTVVILLIVVLNTLMGFWQEFNAEKAMAALKSMTVPFVRVKRGGTIMEISAKEIVPGDIVLVEAGNIIPADGRLVAASNLKVQEAALTGESEPVEKHTDTLAGEKIALGDRKNMIFMGTVVTYGRGEALITGTGMKTELGNIAAMLQGVEDEQTPLQKRLAKLGTTLALAALGLIVVVAALSYLRGVDLKTTFMTAISMAVAAIPEGLPAVVTIALALGAKRMLKKKSLIRHLPSVETLGSVTVICSDKTGTLTQNKMTVTDILLPDRTQKMDEVVKVHEEKKENKQISLLLLSGMLTNDAVLKPADKEGEFDAIGDPTEGSIVIAAKKIGLDKQETESILARTAELPFDSVRKRMTTIHDLSDCKDKRLTSLIELAAGTSFGELIKKTPCAAFTKGSADGLLEVSTRVMINGKVTKLTGQIKDSILEQNREMAAAGIRVLGITCKFMDKTSVGDTAGYEKELIFIGMTGMIDPVRPEAIDAVGECKLAGIRPVMITGDHPLTACAIAKQLGIISGENKFITGAQLSELTVEELEEKVDEVSVYARVSPEHKMKIIDALQDKGQVVSMTGDGVNDAPALKSADIGVAMGITGTDVSKESADMVLLDDNFATIVGAVKEGRTIFDNIRKFIKYILTGNAGEIVTMLAGPIIGIPLPLLPIQILWINLVTDGAPAIALGYEPAEKEVMHRPPMSPKEGIFSRGVGPQILIMGLLVGLLSISVGYYFNKIVGSDAWQTMVFTTLTFCQMAFALCVRSNKRSLFATNPLTNIPMLLAVPATLGLQMLLVYVPFFNVIFKTKPLDLNELGACFAASAVVIVVSEIIKLVGFLTRKK